MKTSTILAGLAAQMASAHYTFMTTVNNGAESKGWEFIRKVNKTPEYNPIKFSSNPSSDTYNSFADKEDIVCNNGAFAAAANTKVMEVAAGSDVTVHLAFGAKMGHPGPSLVYMSRAPSDDVKSYSGIGGDWFKIKEAGVCDTSKDFTKDAWCGYNDETMTATIPKDTPSGEYLMRFEHIGIHRSHVNQPEHYTSCVQVKVTGGGSGTPGPTFVLPGGYKATDEYANFSIYGGAKAFPMPGPAVWSAGAGSGSGSGSGSAPATEAPAAEKPAETKPATPVAEKPAAQPANPPATGGSSNCAAKYGQCGGTGFNGPKCCASGSSCKVGNAWYSQCL